jgi:hypothetical protein
MYDKPNPGQPMYVNLKKRHFAHQGNYKMACCDCSLVHIMRFEIEKSTGRLIIRAWRDNRATGQMRRKRKKKKG